LAWTNALAYFAQANIEMKLYNTDAMVTEYNHIIDFCHK